MPLCSYDQRQDKMPILTQLASQADNFWLKILKTNVQRDVKNMNTPNPQPSYLLLSNDQVQCFYIQYLIKKAGIVGYISNLNWGCNHQPSNALCSLEFLYSQIKNAEKAVKPVRDVECNRSPLSINTPWQQLLTAMSAIKLS